MWLTWVSGLATVEESVGKLVVQGGYLLTWSGFYRAVRLLLMRERAGRRNDGPQLVVSFLRPRESLAMGWDIRRFSHSAKGHVQ